MIGKIPESREVLEQALTDFSLPGWNETSNDPQIPCTYWWAGAGDLYLGVIPQDEERFAWFVSQGRRGDRDKESIPLQQGLSSTPELARKSATAWYNEYARHLPKRG
jgi:hypothetical protein